MFYIQASAQEDLSSATWHITERYMPTLACTSIPFCPPCIICPNIYHCIYHTTLYIWKQQAKGEYERIKQLGGGEVMTRILQIMSLLAPLRKICNGGQLHARDIAVPKVGDLVSAAATANLVAGDDAPVCTAEVELEG
jgi:hypothetical protein